jgi:hypothetical protein
VARWLVSLDLTTSSASLNVAAHLRSWSTARTAWCSGL